MREIKIKIMFTEEVLGSANNDQKIHSEALMCNVMEFERRMEHARD